MLEFETRNGVSLAEFDEYSIGIVYDASSCSGPGGWAATILNGRAKIVASEGRFSTFSAAQEWAGDKVRSLMKKKDASQQLDEKLTAILVTLEGLSAEMREVWMRLERLEHPAIVIKTEPSKIDYIYRDRGDFDD